MGSKYPILKPLELIRALNSFGFEFKSQKGSHAKYVKISQNMPKRTVIIPMHDEIAKGTLQSILEQAGLSLKELMEKM